jgi:adenylate cyclase
MAEEKTPAEALGLGPPRYSAVELSEKTGISIDDAKRIWRALGFVVRPVEEVYFTDADLEVLQTIAEFTKADLASLDVIVSMTRTISQSVARIAEAEAEAMRDRVRREGATVSPEDAAEIFPLIVPPLERFLIHAWRRHLDAALARIQAFDPDAADVTMAIGFADLVGFTRLSREVDDKDLANVVEQLEQRAQDIISTHGGRVVKMIGDEVMFSSVDPVAAASMALELAEQRVGDPPLTLRGGLAYGPVLSQRGDFFGPVVNLARRAGSAARPQSVLTSDDFRREIDRDPRFSVKPIAPRTLKGFGTTRLWVLRAADEERPNVQT